MPPQHDSLHSAPPPELYRSSSALSRHVSTSGLERHHSHALVEERHPHQHSQMPRRTSSPAYAPPHSGSRHREWTFRTFFVWGVGFLALLAFFVTMVMWLSTWCWLLCCLIFLSAPSSVLPSPYSVEKARFHGWGSARSDGDVIYRLRLEIANDRFRSTNRSTTIFSACSSSGRRGGIDSFISRRTVS
ncbi:hypothetical protein M433DRAFT_297774 [Acidomyces richmondensis BFW]|nr:MAG: hypothetical protein FE78DRAFT_474494 [Acidomyces sp. 'richmondensis']KYG49480.1 hypothetical protein M433DRAFT_297774 [Acidomyces richmondensis BFW]